MNQVSKIIIIIIIIIIKKKKDKREVKTDGERGEWREREVERILFILFFILFLFQIYGNRTIGFCRG